MNERIRNIENLLINNKVSAAILELKAFFEEYNEEELNSKCILLLSRFNNFNSKSSLGIIDYLDSENNKIYLAATDLISAAKKLDQTKETKTDKKSKRKKQSELSFLLEEYFENNAEKWPVDNNKYYSSKVVNGTYKIETFDRPSATSFTIIKPISFKKKFTLKTGISFLDGNDDRPFGMIWGRAGKKNGVKFLIRATGYFSVCYNVDNSLIWLINWTHNNAIRKGINLNTMEVIKTESLMHYKINDEVVATTDHLPSFGNKIGFHVEDNIKIAVHDFIIMN